jgi:ABC-2 type transport system ATP-binding protein
VACLTIESVSKRFGDLPVLKDLSFEVEEGSIFGFIGKNGSGKTTTMKIIVGLLKADRGTVSVEGRRVTFGETATNRLVGFLPDVPEFYGFMSALEYLTFCGKIAGMNRPDILRKAQELLVLVGLTGAETRRLKGYSRGMKQRLGIAQALLHDPVLLICDEPTSALDPVGRAELLGILSRVRERTTILFSTHILADVERICDYIGVLDQGSIALEGKLDVIKSTHRSDVIVIELDRQMQGASTKAASGDGTLPQSPAPPDAGVEHSPAPPDAVLPQNPPPPDAVLPQNPAPPVGRPVQGLAPPVGRPAHDPVGKAVDRLRALPFVRSVEWRDGLIRVGVRSVETDGRLLLAELAGGPFTVLRYQVQEPTLENLYREVIA